MSRVTVILPIHEFNETVKNFLNSAVESVLKQVESIPKLLVVYTHRAEEGGVLDYFNEKNIPGISLIKNEGKTDFCGQINFGAKNSDTEYFSILEYDDEYSSIYFRNVDKNINELTDVSIFLPITIDVDDKTNQPVQIVNQNIWSNGYIGENGTLGYLNNKALSEFSFYTLGGSIIKKSDFLAIGGLKSNITLAFTFEFLLRSLNNGNKVYVLPKFGYKHVINRDGSLFMGYAAQLTQEDRRFWYETASKEAHFFNDREIVRSKIKVDEAMSE